MMSKILVIAAVALMAALALPVKGQQPGSQCTATMVNTVAPCMNFLTNNNANLSTPSSDCCNSLRSLTTGGMGCLCLIVTGTMPFQLPINRTTAVSLPRACNMPQVPVQCKANVAPAAAPGPASFGPTITPSPAVTPVAPEPTSAAQPPQSDSTPLLPPTSPTTVDSGAPTADVGGSSRPSLTPSSAFRSTYALSPSLLLSALALVLLKYY